jgi:hypothetical protein
MPPSPEEEAFAVEGAALASAILAALPIWAARVVAERGGSVEAGLSAGTAAAERIEPALRALLAADVDAQRGNPLAVVRDAVPVVTAALRDAGAPEVERDPFDREHFPDDHFGITPMTWSDLDASLVEPGIRWGAMKAHLHMARHR